MPKILIVDDNEESRDALAGRLQCRGFEVVLARDGKMGVTLAQAEKPDLILMDMNMPTMDGWEATRQIKAASGSADPPIVALTEHAMPSDRERAMAAGCADSQSKPLEFADLLGRIEDLLQNRPKSEVPLLPQCECLPG